MKRLFQTCLLALLAVAARAVETTLNVDTSQPKAVLPYLSFDQGAVYDYRVYVKSSGRRAELTGADVCVIQFSSNLTDSAWAVFTSTSVNTNNGSFLVPSGYFTGPLGDGFYQVYTYSTNNPARKYGLGNGTYRLEQTSGYGAVTPGFYTVPLNTDIVEQTGSNRFARLSEIISASGYVTTNAFYGTTDVLRASVTTLFGTVDATNALFNAWFAGLFSETNKWNVAYGWGNWASPVASNTAAIAVLQTNTLTRADGLAYVTKEAFSTNRVTRWYDPEDPNRFGQLEGGTNIVIYKAEVSGTNLIVTLSDGFKETVTGTRPAWTNNVWPFTDATGLWRADGDEEAGGFNIEWGEQPTPNPAMWAAVYTGYPVVILPTLNAQGTATVSIASFNLTTNVEWRYFLPTNAIPPELANLDNLQGWLNNLYAGKGDFDAHVTGGSHTGLLVTSYLNTSAVTGGVDLTSAAYVRVPEPSAGSDAATADFVRSLVAVGNPYYSTTNVAYVAYDPTNAAFFSSLTIPPLSSTTFPVVSNNAYVLSMTTPTKFTGELRGPMTLHTHIYIPTGVPAANYNLSLAPELYYTMDTNSPALSLGDWADNPEALTPGVTNENTWTISFPNTQVTNAWVVVRLKASAKGSAANSATLVHGGEYASYAQLRTLGTDTLGDRGGTNMVVGTTPVPYSPTTRTFNATGVLLPATLTNGVSIFGGWSNSIPTVSFRYGTTNFNILLVAP